MSRLENKVAAAEKHIRDLEVKTDTASAKFEGLKGVMDKNNLLARVEAIEKLLGIGGQQIN